MKSFDQLYDEIIEENKKFAVLIKNNIHIFFTFIDTIFKEKFYASIKDITEQDFLLAQNLYLQDLNKNEKIIRNIDTDTIGNVNKFTNYKFSDQTNETLYMLLGKESVKYNIDNNPFDYFKDDFLLLKSAIKKLLPVAASTRNNLLQR